MGSSYKGVDYFGSGPHRFEMGERARRLVALSTLSGDVTDAGTLEFGNREVRVYVKGRLVAGSETALWALRDAITAQAVAGVVSGTLEDQYGREWESMKLLSYEEDGPTARGREVSIGYVAEFGELLTA